MTVLQFHMKQITDQPKAQKPFHVEQMEKTILLDQLAAVFHYARAKWHDLDVPHWSAVDRPTRETLTQLAQDVLTGELAPTRCEWCGNPCEMNDEFCSESCRVAAETEGA